VKKIRNILLSGVMATTLTACGGGSGGGAISSVSDFVQDELSSLTGSESIISSYSSLLSGFNSTISSGNLATLSDIITGPTEKDIAKAGNLLSMLNQAETLWDQTVDLIESQDADTKLQIYNSEDYKNAHAALLYLKNHVKPVIQKVSQGKKLSLTEYNKVASDKKAQEIIEQEKENTVETYVVDKKTKINQDKQIQIAKKETKDEETVEQEEKKEQETKKEEEVKEQEETKKEEEVKEEDVKEEEKIVEKQKEVNTDKKEEVKEEKKEEVKEEKKVVEKEKNIWKTAEFNKDTSKTIINADKAYARGWTGKGAVLGVIDTYQQTDHEALHGKYKWYKDYVLNDTIVENKGQYQSHGTHVAGIVAGKKDDNEFHGVAFDANLVGANVDYYGNASANMGQAQNALHDIAKLKATKADGGEGINIIAVNMSFNKTVQFNHYGTITKLDDGTYSSSVVSANKGSS
jgi:chemotaxis protein histidine kinase CheA